MNMVGSYKRKGNSMTKLCVAMMVLAMAMFSGCANLQELGVTKEVAAAGIRLAAQKQGVSHAITDEQVDEFLNIVIAEERLNAIGAEIAKDEIVQGKLDAIVSRYVFGGEVIDPEAIAEAAPHIATLIDDWYGSDYSSAVLDPRFKLTVSRDGVHWSAAPSDWPFDKHETDCNVRVCAAYQNASGQWVGGMYEWNRADPSPRSWNNITGEGKDGPYHGWVAPPTGTVMRVWCVSTDNQMMSTETTAIYK